MPGPSNTFERLSEPILASLATGTSIPDAARRHGCHPRTIKKWLERGRRSPDGPYGRFAHSVDSHRQGRAVPREGVPDLEELLLLLSDAARAGSVPAMKELSWYEAPARSLGGRGPLDRFDELAERRDR